MYMQLYTDQHKVYLIKQHVLCVCIYRTFVIHNCMTLCVNTYQARKKSYRILQSLAHAIVNYSLYVHNGWYTISFTYNKKLMFYMCVYIMLNSMTLKSSPIRKPDVTCTSQSQMLHKNTCLMEYSLSLVTSGLPNSACSDTFV